MLLKKHNPTNAAPMHNAAMRTRATGSKIIQAHNK